MRSALVSGTYGLFVREMTKWLRQRFQIVLAFTVPLVWLFLFGKSFDLTSFLRLPLDIPPALREQVAAMMEEVILRVFGSLSYFDFFAVGMLSAFALFTSMWSGMSLVWDRRLGYLERLLVAPIPRTSIYLSKVSASLAKGLLQFTAMLLIVFALGFHPKPGISALDLAALYLVMTALILALSAIFTAVAVRVTSHDVVISIANLVNLPLLFTSNAIFPLSQMPSWMQTIAALNPLTHSITIARFLLLGLGGAGALLPSSVYLALFTLAAILLGSLVASRSL